MLKDIIINDLQYEVTLDNDVYKVVDGELIPPTKDEMKIFNKIFKNNVFKCAKLNKIAKSNLNIKKIDYLIPVLDEVEASIPDIYKDLFYENLINLEISFTNDPIKNNVCACYDVYNNKILLNINKITELKNNYNHEEFDTYFKHILRHELFHMSSHSFTNDLFSFVDNSIVRNDFINEGITEIYTSRFDNIIYGYDIETRIIAQLSYILPNGIIDNIYFNDLGIRPLIEELTKIIDSPELAKLFFNCLDDYNNADDIDYKYKNLLLAQNILLSFVSKKCEMISKDEVKELVEVIDSNLIRCNLLDLNQVFNKTSINDLDYDNNVAVFSLRDKYIKHKHHLK